LLLKNKPHILGYEASIWRPQIPGPILSDLRILA